MYRKKGFTLIELLIVIAIIAILFIDPGARGPQGQGAGQICGL